MHRCLYLETHHNIGAGWSCGTSHAAYTASFDCRKFVHIDTSPFSILLTPRPPSCRPCNRPFNRLGNFSLQPTVLEELLDHCTSARSAENLFKPIQTTPSSRTQPREELGRLLEELTTGLGAEGQYVHFLVRLGTHPLYLLQYDASSLRIETEKRELFVRDFVGKGGLGRTLQERLKGPYWSSYFIVRLVEMTVPARDLRADWRADLDHVSPNNWLNDTLWLGLAYHTWRAPLLVNSNWWLLFAPDPKDPSPPTYGSTPNSAASSPNPDAKHNLPEGSQGGGDEWLASHEKLDDLISFERAVKREEVTGWQVRKAAWLARRFAEFRVKVQR